MFGKKLVDSKKYEAMLEDSKKYEAMVEKAARLEKRIDSMRCENFRTKDNLEAAKSANPYSTHWAPADKSKMINAVIGSFEWHAYKVAEFMKARRGKIEKISREAGYPVSAICMMLMDESRMRIPSPHKDVVDMGLNLCPDFEATWEHHMDFYLDWLVFVDKTARIGFPEPRVPGDVLPKRKLADSNKERLDVKDIDEMIAPDPVLEKKIELVQAILNAGEAAAKICRDDKLKGWLTDALSDLRLSDLAKMSTADLIKIIGRPLLLAGYVEENPIPPLNLVDDILREARATEDACAAGLAEGEKAAASTPPEYSAEDIIREARAIANAFAAGRAEGEKAAASKPPKAGPAHAGPAHAGPAAGAAKAAGSDQPAASEPTTTADDYDELIDVEELHEAKSKLLTMVMKEYGPIIYPTLVDYFGVNGLYSMFSDVYDKTVNEIIANSGGNKVSAIQAADTITRAIDDLLQNLLDDAALVRATIGDVAELLSDPED